METHHHPVAAAPSLDNRDAPTNFIYHSPDNVAFNPPAFHPHRALPPSPPYRSSTLPQPPPPPNDYKNTCYYSYDQLRPLILPLILGRVEEETFHGIKKRCQDNHGDSTTHIVPPSPIKPPKKDHEEKHSQPAAPPSSISNNGSQKIKSVLEINSGVNPLSLPLQNDLLSLQYVTGLNATLVVNKIICCDDDERNIDYLLGQSQHKDGTQSDDDDDEEEDEEMVKIVEKDGRWRLKRRRGQQHFSLDGEKKPMFCMSTDDEDEGNKRLVIHHDSRRGAGPRTLELDDDNRMVSLSPAQHAHHQQQQGKDKVSDSDNSTKETTKEEESQEQKEQRELSALRSSPLRPIERAASAGSSSYQQITPPCKEQTHFYPDNIPREELDVEYIIANASQQIPYGNDEFHLIIEKSMGLDVMMHQHYHPYNWQEKERCNMMVTEMARVLAEGGYMMVVSRMNADTEQGRDWVNEVIVPGLRAGGGDAMWEIEVHAFNDTDNGCDNTDDDDTNEDEDENNEESTPVEDRGQAEEERKADEDQRLLNHWERNAPSPQGISPPSVYIIHKMPPPSSTTNDKDQADHRDDADENDKNNCHSSPPTTSIPLNFVTYSHDHLNGFQP